MEIKLWEILVPTIRPDGRPIKARFHRVWDKKVYDLTNGLTVMTPTKGKWVNSNGELFAERMIPVRIACTREQIKQIVDFSLTYYDQEAIMAYLLSEEVIIKHR